MEYRSFVAVVLCAVIAPGAELGWAWGSARLDFDAEAMNDVLKSLTMTAGPTVNWS
jgi:hypothetical protein